MVNLGDALNVAIQQYQAGQRDAAEDICRQILTKAPRQPETLHLLGVIEHDAGHDDRARRHIEKAIAADGKNASFHLSLGIVHKALGSLDKAIDSYRRAVKLNGKFAEALCNLSNALWARGDMDEAVAIGRRAVAARPDMSQAHNNLANALKALGRLDEAIVHYEHALLLKGDDPEVCRNLGNLLRLKRRHDEAVAMLRRSVELAPDIGAGHNCLGVALQAVGMILEAKQCFERSLQLDAADADALISLGNVSKDLGDAQQALDYYRRALVLDPHNQVAYENLLFTMHFVLDADRTEVFAQHLCWGRAVLASMPPRVQVTNDRRPDRRLRIGYVSPDFRTHAVACFFVPIIAEHDPEAVETFCYAQVPHPDTTTAQIRKHAHNWRNACGVSDENLGMMIRSDRIDILVDLAGHSESSRLTVFARKPAPVQVTYLGYSNTTGLETIDYMISDAVGDPPDDATLYVEELVRLDGCFLCYAPPTYAGEVTALPGATAGAVTFGSITNPAKLNRRVLDVWARVLQASPSARLLMVRDSFQGEIRQRLIDQFVERGVAADRLLIEHEAPAGGHRIRVYDRIDIALDPFPYSGATTTCEALWMGVPVITLKGHALAARHSTSILTHCGLGQLVAETPEQYVSIATDLASDAPRLARMRAALRPQLAGSPLCDGAKFTRGLEAAYRRMWHKWCGTAVPGAGAGADTQKQD